MERSTTSVAHIYIKRFSRYSSDSGSFGAPFLILNSSSNFFFYAAIFSSSVISDSSFYLSSSVPFSVKARIFEVALGESLFLAITPTLLSYLRISVILL